MPTFNQLVKKGRETSERKPKAPALLRSFNSLHKKPFADNCPSRRRVHRRQDGDPEEAELRAEKDRESPSLERR